MSHLELEHHVAITVSSTDTELLDSLESELPDADAPEVGSEYTGPSRRELEDSEATRLSARVVLQTTYTESGDVNQYAETYAQNLYDALTGHDLSAAALYEILHYQSPTGGVTAEAVRAFYEENPDLQPTDEDGETYVPSSFDPTNHIIAEENG